LACESTTSTSVIILVEPAKAGFQAKPLLDPGFRRDDDPGWSYVSYKIFVMFYVKAKGKILKLMTLGLRRDDQTTLRLPPFHIGKKHREKHF
jgi:hypothetical protein